MADVKITIEEKLGGQVSFGGKEIKVLKATYEAVPEDKRAEFDAVLIQAQEVYQNKVAEVKKTGARPQASKLKAEAIAEVVNPFLEQNSVAKGSVKKGETRVVKPTVSTRAEQNIVREKVDKETLQAEFDDFPTDILDDSSDKSVTSEPKGEFDDLEEELGLDDVLGEGEEDVFSSSSHNDPFDTDSSDPFDIDLDI